MKKKLFLARLRPSEDPNEYFVLTRGEEFATESIKGLAIVRASIKDDCLVFKGEWSIIDIDSGLFIFKAKTKKILLDNWIARFQNPSCDLVNKIINARKTDSYRKHCRLLEDDKRLWRQSGYDL